MVKLIKTLSSDETKNVAYNLVSQLEHGTLLALYGDLGSGKTTFTQGIAEAFNIERTVQSPTFILMREYDIKHPKIKRLYHVDLYRLDKYENDELGLKDAMNDESALVVIEWADKMKNLLPMQRIDVFFEAHDESTRQIRIDDKR